MLGYLAKKDKIKNCTLQQNFTSNDDKDSELVC